VRVGLGTDALAGPVQGEVSQSTVTANSDSEAGLRGSVVASAVWIGGWVSVQPGFRASAYAHLVTRPGSRWRLRLAWALSLLGAGVSVVINTVWGDAVGLMLVTVCLGSLVSGMIRP
jgi:hypothetical protein